MRLAIIQLIAHARLSKSERFSRHVILIYYHQIIIIIVKCVTTTALIVVTFLLIYGSVSFEAGGCGVHGREPRLEMLENLLLLLDNDAPLLRWFVFRFDQVGIRNRLWLLLRPVVRLGWRADGLQIAQIGGHIIIRRRTGTAIIILEFLQMLLHLLLVFYIKQLITLPLCSHTIFLVLIVFIQFAA